MSPSAAIHKTRSAPSFICLACTVDLSTLSCQLKPRQSLPCQSNVTQCQDSLLKDYYFWFMTREEIERRMDELARKYIETRDHEIIEELYKLRLELKRLGKESSA